MKFWKFFAANSMIFEKKNPQNETIFNNICKIFIAGSSRVAKDV
jgi:hypothetical protein